MTRFLSCLAGAVPAESNAVFFAFEKEKKPAGSFLFGTSVEKAFLEAREDGFDGKAGQIASIRARDRRVTRYIFVGLGAEADATLDSLRRAASAAGRKAAAMGLKSIYIRPAHLGGSAVMAQAVVEGFLLGTYKFTAFFSAPANKSKTALVGIVAKDASEKSQFDKGIRTGEIFANAVTFARDLINTPPTDATPEKMVKAARGVTGSGVTVKVFNKAQITKMGMGALLGVNRGSWQPPYFLHFTYKPKGKPSRRIGFCGKGITFDSGGLSLKPPASMETMKYDMAGAASVFALFKAIGQLQPSAEIHGFTPLTENMPGGNAMKPGDVVRSMKGKTIEVLNTDAEGRLVLADALAYAGKENLDELFDMATLTGAATIALGPAICAMMGTSPELIGKIKAASTLSGEKFWELPLEKEYEAHIKSPIADLKNIGNAGQAGTIIGGLFLKEFVNKGQPWVHLDIASVGWTNGQNALSEPGATGFIIRTLLHHILSYNRAS